MQSFTDLFPARELEKKREDGLFERKMTLTRRNVGSIAVPGCDIKVERKTSKRPTMAQLSSGNGHSYPEIIDSQILITFVIFITIFYHRQITFFVL